MLSVVPALSHVKPSTEHSLQVFSLESSSIVVSSKYDFSQISQLEDPTAELVRSEHIMHTMLAVVLDLYPAGQSLHTVAARVTCVSSPPPLVVSAALEAYLPVGQAVHVVATAIEIWPDPQLVQLLAPSLEYCPASHPVADASPVLGQEKPPGQVVHDVCAAAAWYFPASQAVQSLLDVA